MYIMQLLPIEVRVRMDAKASARVVDHTFQ